MFGHYADRFDPASKAGVDTIPRKGHRARSPGGGTVQAPYAHQEAPPSADALNAGLAKLGIRVSPRQVEKLRKMGGDEVLQSLVRIGGDARGAAKAPDSRLSVSSPSSSPKPKPPAPAASRYLDEALGHHNHKAAHTDRKNKDSVPKLLSLSGAESKRQVLPGDSADDKDRVVTGLQSDRHRLYRQQVLAQNKVRKNILERLKGAGTNARSVFKKLAAKSGKPGEISLRSQDFRRGLQHLTGVQVSQSDLKELMRHVDPDGRGEVTEGSISRALNDVGTIPTVTRGKQAKKQQMYERQHEHRREAGYAVSNTDRKWQALRDAVSTIDNRITTRYGSDPGRLRRMFRAFQSNGDGTISVSKLRAGLSRVGVKKDEFAALMEGLVDVQKTVHAPVGKEDVYFSDLVQVFTHSHAAPEDTPFTSLAAAPSSVHGRTLPALARGLLGWDGLRNLPRAPASL